MKALAIVGSPNPNGSTAYLIRTMLKGMEKVGVETRCYCLGEEKINYCTGCKMCYKDGKCIQHDSMDKIIEDFKEADIIIIGTPDYWGYVSGQLKVFFDRNTPYANTNPRRISMEKRRVGISVSVREGGTERENKSIVESIEHYFRHMEVEPVANLTVTKVSSLDDLKQNNQEKIDEAYELGKRILNLINKN